MCAAELSIVRLSMPLIPHTQAGAEAADYVIIYEANRLHERVADLWATNRKPCLIRSLLNACDSPVSAGRSRSDRGALTIGRPPTNAQR
jgi:hypothetical protein